MPSPLFVYYGGQDPRLITGAAFTGPANRSYFDGAGILQKAAVNVPRYAHYIGSTPHLLLEAFARANQVLYSEDTANAAWVVNSGIKGCTSNAALAPDGTMTADRWDLGGSNGVYIGQNVAIAGGTANKTITVSVWVRAVSGSSAVRLKNSHMGVLDHYSADLPINETWQRLTYTVTNGASAGTGYQGCAARCPTLGTGLDQPVSVYVWGWQVEEWPVATSYIGPTTSGSITLAAEKLTFANPPAPQEMTVWADFVNLGLFPGVDGMRVWHLGALATTPRFACYPSGGGVRAAYTPASGGSTSTGAAPALNDRVRSRTQLTAAGVVTEGVTLNAGSEAVAAAGAACTIGAAWGTATSALGSDPSGTNGGPLAIRTFAVLSGLQSFATCDALSNQPPSQPGAFTAPAAGAHFASGATAHFAWGASVDPEGLGVQYRGEITDDDGATWTPLFPLQVGAAYDLDSTGYAPGWYRIRVYASDGTAESAAREGPDVYLSNRAPAAPVITAPAGGSSADATAHIACDAVVDADGDPVTYEFEGSADDGATWTPLAVGLADPAYDWNTSAIAYTTTARVRVRASDGYEAGAWATSDPFTIAHPGPAPSAPRLEVVPSVYSAELLLTYVRGGGGVHQASEFRIEELLGDYSSPLFESGWVDDATRTDLFAEPGLVGGTQYKVQARTRDTGGNVSDWSAELVFRTLALYQPAQAPLRARDISGNDRHGTYCIDESFDGGYVGDTNTANGPDARVPGLFGDGSRAAGFRGSEGHVENADIVAYGAVLGEINPPVGWTSDGVTVDPTKKFAVDMVIRPDTLPFYGLRALVGYGDSWWDIALDYSLAQPGMVRLRPQLYLEAPASGGSGRYWTNEIAGGPLVTADEPHHVALFYSVPDECALLLVDGVVVWTESLRDHFGPGLGLSFFSGGAYHALTLGRATVIAGVNTFTGSAQYLSVYKGGCSVARLQAHAAAWSAGDSAAYEAAVLADTPDLCWPLADPAGPDKPVLAVTKVGEVLDLAGSAFATEDAGVQGTVSTHVASRWEGDVGSGTFADPALDTGEDGGHLVAYETAAGFFIGRPLKFRVAYKDSFGIWGPWSDPAPWAPACFGGFRLTFFDEDDVTPILGVADVDGTVLEGSFHTSLGCPRPYLKIPSAFSDAQVDFPNGRSVIGAVSVEVVDKRTDPTDQATGIVTSILDQLLGARALLDRYVLGVGWVPLQDGVVNAIDLNERLVTFKFGVRDPRERERVPLFTRSNAVVWPSQGPASDWGLVPGSSQPLFPTPEPKWGVFHSLPLLDATPAGYVDFSSLVWADCAAAAALVGEPAALPGQDGLTPGMLPRCYYPDAIVQWRARGSADPWKNLGNMVADFLPTNLFSAFWIPVGIIGVPTSPFAGHPRIYMQAPDAGDLPTDLQEVDVRVLSTRAPSEDEPFYWEGTFGELLKACYDGTFCPTPPRIRYGVAAMADFVASTPKTRIRITAPEEDLRTWVEENVYKVLGYAPVLNAAFEIEPVSWAFPDTGEVLLVLDDSNVAPGGAAWTLGTDNSVTAVEFTYLRDSLVSGQLEEREVVRVHRSMSRLPDQPLEFKPVTVRALGTVDGKALTNDLSAELGERLAAARAQDVLDRFMNGAPQITCRARASDAAVRDARPGQWRRVQLSWMPDPRTGKRGLDHAMQIVAVKVNSSGWTDLTLVDGTDEATAPPAVPDCEVAAPTINADGNLSVEVVSVPAEYFCRLEFAVSEVEPDPSSGLWALWARVDAATTITSAPPPDGQAIWIRYRSESPGMRPGPWATAGSVGDSLLPAISALSITTVTVGTDGTATVHWTPNAACTGLRIWYGIADQSDPNPQFTTQVDVDASLGEYEIPETADLTTPQMVGVLVVPFRLFAAGACSGTSGLWDQAHVNF